MDNKNNNWYFHPPQPVPKTTEEAKAMNEARCENEAVWNRSGHRGMYSRLLKGGYFKSLKEIMQQRFDVVVGIVSLENAL